MVGKDCVKCVKCGRTSKENPSLTFHRFPLPSMHGSLKAKVWATFCFPDDDWTSNESLNKLYKQHKMLCGNHFDNSSFTSNDRKRLNKFAVPAEAQSILTRLREECNKLSSSSEIKNRESTTISELHMETTPSTSGSFIQRQLHDENPNLPRKSSSKGILKELKVKNVIELSPKKMKLYKRCRRNITEILRLRRNLQKIKKSERSILNTLTGDDCVNNLIKQNMSSSFWLLLQSQLKNVPRKLTGRRWSIDDKVLALSLYKKSSSCYRLLRRLFCLPSISSLKALLNKIPLVCGINEQVVDTIAQIAEKRGIHDNLCMLAFDEMSIRKNLTYNTKLDQIDGYQDHAHQGRTCEIASHALTFMAIGLRKHWKQPIAFYFSGDSVTADRLAVLIKEVVSACFRAGLEVVGTVCDLDGVNIRAINSLGSTIDKPFFYFEGHEIVTILDPPHLLKCFRNNFLKHDVQFTQDLIIDGEQIQGVAKWGHIKEFYTKDNLNKNFVFAPALTQQHLEPNGKQKMKVRLAAQVLSHSVAAGIFAKVALNELPQDAVATASLISNMDKLFDAVNGDTPDRKRGKEYLTNMTSTGPHIPYFNKMIEFFKSMKFVGARSRPPSQDGWLRTLNGVKRLFCNISSKYNLKTLSVRRLNQDPLENCFGCIRSNCGCNPNPTSVQFIAALKTSIITNLININKNRNCLNDNNDLLNNFKIFLERKSDVNVNLSTFNYSNLLNVEEIECTQCSSEMQACAYVCGFIIKNMNVNCCNCKSIMLADQVTELSNFTSFKEYSDDSISLNYVSYNFCEMVESAANKINIYLNEYSFKQGVKLNLNKICNEIDTVWLKGCEEHFEINKNHIINSTIAICLKRFCILKNQNFVKEASKKAMKRKINILKHSYICVLFFNYFSFELCLSFLC